ncbi:DUF502 domain-containing protein [Sagittula sp. MA-2]|jgi:uncharacterized membrane protein|uniref:DUF502 domain-containing protein n=1 Tax=Sagittula sp. MA-2 TaxID=3048007 RepID=UPI0024C2CD09|nr:DUF502 domain-containing protein [Sagittula sp. MA-2]WHZ37317.1 DUF502 domain-containing protein [Sagittula sp. MA-2]
MNMPFEPEPKKRGRLLANLRNSFLTGIVVIAPVGLTVWLIWTVVGWVDGVVWPFVPDRLQPNALLNRWMVDASGDPRIPWLFEFLDSNNDGILEVNVRGLGVVVFLLFTIIVGWIAKGLIGRSMINFAESLVDRTPVVRSIYSGIKQLAETVFAQSERSFEKACLIEYPRKGIWAIGFISTDAKGEIARRTPTSAGLTSVFVPTTPNPTSGFLLFFPVEDVIELDMTIEDAAKLVISAGLVYPNGQEAKQAVEEWAKAS